VAALTNTWKDSADLHGPGSIPQLRELFDVFVDSSAVGMRKPERLIYDVSNQRSDIARWLRHSHSVPRSSYLQAAYRRCFDHTAAMPAIAHLLSPSSPEGSLHPRCSTPCPS